MSAFEKVEHTAPPPASPRSVGYTFAAVSAIAAVLLRNHVQLSLALVAPRWLKGLAYLWGLLALGLAKIVNPLVMGIMYYGFITPYGLLLRMGRDPLRIHKRPQTGSYWCESTDPQDRAAMERQF